MKRLIGSFGAGILISTLLHNAVSRIGMEKVIEDMVIARNKAFYRVEADVVLRHVSKKMQSHVSHAEKGV